MTDRRGVLWIVTFHAVAMLSAGHVGCGDDGGDEVVPPPFNNVVNSENNSTPYCPPGLVFSEGQCIDEKAPPSPFSCAIPPTEPCGGDLVGNWIYTDSCEVPGYNSLLLECGSDSRHFQYSEYQGDLTFREGGQYASTYAASYFSISTVAKACSGATTCDDLGGELGLGECTEDADVCDCSRTLVEEEPSTVEGTYKISHGTGIVFDESGDLSHYCIEGDSLFLLRASMDGLEPMLLTRDAGTGEGE